MSSKNKFFCLYFSVALLFLFQVILNFYIIPVDLVVKILTIPDNSAMIFYVWAYFCAIVFAAGVILSFLVKFFPKNKISKFLVSKTMGYMDIIFTLCFATIFTMFSWPIVTVLFSKGEIVIKQFVSIYAFWYFFFAGLKALSGKAKVEVLGKKIEY